ncbi:MAG: hypothetical protein ACRDJH_26920, partial [Thermomicrobiales bacterium]
MTLEQGRMLIEVLIGDPPASRYIEEVLGHAGMSYRRTTREELTSSAPATALVLLVGNGIANAALRDWLFEVVRSGGAVLAIGGTWGLDEILGVRSSGSQAEGYLRVDAQH